jgi:hypothetical protein
LKKLWRFDETGLKMLDIDQEMLSQWLSGLPCLLLDKNHLLACM